MLELLAHWLHVLAAVIWVGGTLALALVFQPVMRKSLETPLRLKLYREIGKKFTRLQWLCWGVLAATGTYKLLPWFQGRQAWGVKFGNFLALKLVLVAAMVALSLLHSHVWAPELMKLSPEDPAYRAAAGRLAFWGRVNAALMALILLCAAGMRLN